VLEDLEGGILEYKTVREFFVDIRKEFGGGNKEAVVIRQECGQTLGRVRVRTDIEQYHY